MKNENRLFIVDDEPGIREFFCDVAGDMGFAIADAEGSSDFLSAYDSIQPTAILLDLTLPGTDGVELLRELAERACTAAVILASGQDKRVLATAQRVGTGLGLNMCPPLQKPVDVAVLEQALEDVRRQEPMRPMPYSDGEDTLSTTTPARLERAIKCGELVVHYQPKVDLQCGDQYPVVGSEALVRWNHPTRGLVPPAVFVPVAEETGLIGPMTEVVLQASIAQLRSWKDTGTVHPVSINLSPVQLTDLSLPDRIAMLLDEAEIDPSLLVVEVTEQAAMADIGKANDILTRLRLKNIAVSLDDFGAGFSSLAELYRMPLSELKFDRSLITDIDIDPDARTVVKALVALARTLGIPVCAEGIETWTTAEFLQSIGCEKGQGFVFSKPLPADDLIGMQIGRNTSDEVEQLQLQAS